MTRPTSPWRERVRVPAVVLAATLAFGALLSVWSVVVPLLEAPDEPDHLALVLDLADGHPYPAYDGLRSQASVYDAVCVYVSATRICTRPGEVATPTGVRRHPVADAPPKDSRPTWDAGDGAVGIGPPNQMPQHPPLYYQLMASVLRVERALNGGPWSLDREIALLRLANVVLMTPLPLLAWWGARRFGLDQPTSIAACFAIFAVPMVSHIGATLNNDNLLTLCGTVLIALLAGVLRGDRSLRTGGLIGVVTGAALLTKAFAVVFPPLIVLAYALGTAEPRPPVQGRRRRWVGAAKPLVAAGMIAAVPAAWWYGGVRLRSGSFTPTVEDQALSSSLAPEGFTPHVGGWLGDFLVSVHSRYWGAFGWFTVRFAWPVVLLAGLAVLAGIVSALATRVTPGAEAEPASRWATAWFLAPTALLSVLVAARSYDIYATTSRLIFAQGRYLFAGVAGVAVVVAMGARRGFGRSTPFVLAAAAALLQLYALHACLTVFWGGPGLGPRGQLRAMVAYSGWPGPMIAAIGLAAVGAGAVLAWTLVSLARPVRSSAP